MNLSHSYAALYKSHAGLARLRPAIELVGRVGFLMALYVALERVLRQAGHLPTVSYEQPIIALALLKHVFASPLTAIGCAGVAALLIVRYRHVLTRWSTFEQGDRVRAFVSFVALIGAWTFATYGFNLYFNQPHTLDRLLLVALALLIIWRPVFVIPFTLLLFAIVWQFDYPLVSQYPWTDMNMLVRVLTLWCAAYLIHLLTGKTRIGDFMFVLICLVVSFYFGSGIGKFELNWISFPHLNLLWAGAYANGWLSFLQPTTIASIVKATQPFALPLMVFTLFVEWAGLAILSHRRVTLVFLFGFMAFHTGIFVVTGMLFWKWIAIEAALVILFFARKSTTPQIYSLTHLLLSVVIIATGGYWFKPSNLSWLDTRLAYIYQLRGIGTSGKTYELPIASLTPYADMFTLGNFGYLSHDPQLTHIWGVTSDRTMADALLPTQTSQQIFALEAKQGHVLYDEAASQRFDEFVRRYFSNLNARGSKTTPFSLLQAPAHLWTIPRDPVFAGQESLTRVIVVQRTWLLGDDTTTVIRERVVRSIDIPAKAGATP